MTAQDLAFELELIRFMPYSVARTAAAEQIARRIEADGLVTSLPLALLTVVESHVWAGEPSKAFVSFGKATRLWDEHPEWFDEDDQSLYFWAHKWMVSHLMDYPEIPAAQIEASLADMARRYALAGHGSSAVAYEAYWWARHRGSPDAARRFEEWVGTPRDEFSQCEACSLADEAAHHAADRPERAIAIVDAAVEAGLGCATEPAAMLSSIALVHLDRGDPEAALAAHRRAMAALPSSETDMAAARGQRFELLARGGQPERALRALREDAGLLLRAETPRSRLRFLVSVLAGGSAMPDPDVPLALPGHPATTVGELRAWVHAQASALADAFDRRNGTDAHGRWVAAALASGPATAALDFTVLDAADASGPSAAALEPAGDGSAPTDPADELGRLLAEAESLDALDATADAASAYLAAGAAADRAGLLVDAGFAYAEAARCAENLGDDDGADRAYAGAVARLRAGGTDDEYLAPVLTAWAPVAVHAGAPDALLGELRSALARLAHGDGPPPHPTDDPARARCTAWADLADTLARALASTPGGGHDEAIRYARDAARLYAAQDEHADAAHALWLAGRIQRDHGLLSDAIASLEAAVERSRSARDDALLGAASSALLSLFRETGQESKVTALLASLTRRSG